MTNQEELDHLKDRLTQIPAFADTYEELSNIHKRIEELEAER